MRRTGSLRAIRVEGPAGRRIVDLYPVIAGDGGATPDLSLREGEHVLVPPLGGAVAVGGEVTRPGVYELPAGAASAPLAAVLALAGRPLRPAGNRFVLDTTAARAGAACTRSARATSSGAATRCVWSRARTSSRAASAWPGMSPRR